jgi:hypothetical protein
VLREELAQCRDLASATVACVAGTGGVTPTTETDVE